MQVDGPADLVGGEDLCPRLVGLLDLAERGDQRLVGRGDLVDRNAELHPGREIGDGIDPGRAENFGPEVRVAQVLLGDLADRLVRPDRDDQEILVALRPNRTDGTDGDGKD